MSDDTGLHPHHRLALMAGGIAMLGIGAGVLAAFDRGAAVVLGSAAGLLAAWAGWHWLRRKLGIKSSGRSWRLPKPRPSGGAAKRAGGGSRSGGGKGAASGGGALPGKKAAAAVQAGLKRLTGRKASPGSTGKPGPAGDQKPARKGLLRRPGRGAGKPATPGAPGGTRPDGARPRGIRRIFGPLGRPRRRAAGSTPPGQPKPAGTPRPNGSPKRRKRVRLPRIPADKAILPFALPFAGARWLWRKAARRKPAPKRLTVNKPPRPVRPRPAAAAPAGVPAGTPKQTSPSPAIPNPRLKGPNIMSKIDAASEAILTHIGRFEPQNASDLDNFLSSLPEFFASAGQAFKQVAGRLADAYPVDPSIPDRLNDIGSTITGMADFSGEAHAAHRARHDKELERIEQPRVNEKFWDVQNNQ